jgi:hypothetical protein
VSTRILGRTLAAVRLRIPRSEVRILSGRPRFPYSSGIGFPPFPRLVFAPWPALNSLDERKCGFCLRRRKIWKEIVAKTLSYLSLFGLFFSRLFKTSPQQVGIAHPKKGSHPVGEKGGSQERLDHLLDFYKGQPVGIGYGEIIVHRDTYRSFLKNVLSEGFRIWGICWWEYCDSLEKKSEYGMGGPPCRFYPGWFSEIPIGDDELRPPDSPDIAELEIIDIIENKEIRYSDGVTITFKGHSFLTPAFCLNVPNNWKNEQDREGQLKSRFSKI